MWSAVCRARGFSRWAVSTPSALTPPIKAAVVRATGAVQTSGGRLALLVVAIGPLLIPLTAARAGPLNVSVQPRVNLQFQSHAFLPTNSIISSGIARSPTTPVHIQPVTGSQFRSIISTGLATSPTSPVHIQPVTRSQFRSTNSIVRTGFTHFTKSTTQNTELANPSQFGGNSVMSTGQRPVHIQRATGSMDGRNSVTSTSQTDTDMHPNVVTSGQASSNAVTSPQSGSSSTNVGAPSSYAGSSTGAPTRVSRASCVITSSHHKC